MVLFPLPVGHLSQVAGEATALASSMKNWRPAWQRWMVKGASPCVHNRETHRTIKKINIYANINYIKLYNYDKKNDKSIISTTAEANPLTLICKAHVSFTWPAPLLILTEQFQWGSVVSKHISRTKNAPLMHIMLWRCVTWTSAAQAWRAEFHFFKNFLGQVGPTVCIFLYLFNLYMDIQTLKSAVNSNFRSCWIVTFDSLWCCGRLNIAVELRSFT